MLQLYRSLFFIFIIFFFTKVIALETDWSFGHESQARLISPLTHNNNQSEIYLGIEYKLQDGWKTYWKSPGDGGFPQEVNWENSKNINSLELLWPTPSHFEILGLTSAGYSNKVIFPLKIKLDNIDKDSLVALKIIYLVCKDICIPGEADLEILIPSGKGTPTIHSFNIEKSLSQLPSESLSLSFIEKANSRILVDDNNISLHLFAESKNIFIDPMIFLHTDYGLPVIKPTIILSPDSKQLTAKFNFDKSLLKKEIIDTEIIIVDQNKSFLLKEKNTIEINNSILSYSSLFILLIAFIGGLVLNAMPCVFPVLSIKILNLIDDIGNKNSIRKSFIITSIGISSSFIILALILILFRYLGYNVAWGIQFQEPFFLIFISLIITFFSLNLFGFFEIPIPQFLNLKYFSNLQSHNTTRDYFTGFFVTLMATPCSAPFVGTAITAAFTQSFIMMFFIFFFMGLGLSFPYLFLSIFPNLIQFFPKPGRWMIYVKYLMGFLLVITLIWITNILLNHFNYYFIIAYVVIIIATILISYLFNYKKFIPLITIIIIFSLPNFTFFKSNYDPVDSSWLDFNQIDLQELINDNNFVFVDITADWCATCQYNKINVIKSTEIQNAFSKFNVVKVRGDWSKPNENILKYLNENGRYGIPFNIIYTKINPEGIPLSELLSNKEIIEILTK